MHNLFFWVPTTPQVTQQKGDGNNSSWPPKWVPIFDKRGKEIVQSLFGDSSGKRNACTPEMIQNMEKATYTENKTGQDQQNSLTVID